MVRKAEITSSATMANRKTERRRGLRPRSIYRTEKRKGFARIDNAMLQDSRLSFLARGILASLLSRPNDWEITQAALELAGKEGRDAISGAMRELQHLGYARKERVRNSGKLQGWRWMITESPNHGFPALGEASTERPISEGRETDSREIDGRKTATTKNRDTNDRVTNHQRQTTSPQPPAVEEPKAPLAATIPRKEEGAEDGSRMKRKEEHLRRETFDRIVEAFGRDPIDKDQVWKEFQRNPFDPTPEELEAVERFQAVKLNERERRETGGQCETLKRFFANWQGQVDRATAYAKRQRPKAAIKPKAEASNQQPGGPEGWREAYEQRFGLKPCDTWDVLIESDRASVLDWIGRGNPKPTVSPAATNQPDARDGEERLRDSLQHYCRMSGMPFSSKAVDEGLLLIADGKTTIDELCAKVDESGDHASHARGQKRERLPGPLKLITEEQWRTPSVFGDGTTPTRRSDRERLSMPSEEF